MRAVRRAVWTFSVNAPAARARRETVRTPAPVSRTVPADGTATRSLVPLRLMRSGAGTPAVAGATGAARAGAAASGGAGAGRIAAAAGTPAGQEVSSARLPSQLRTSTW